MAQLIVRRLKDEVNERLKARAKRHGRSVEAEARAILEAATKAEPEEGLGTLMSRRFAKIGLTEEEYRAFDEGIEELRRGSRTRDPRFGQ
jgi:plasmid stability protein